MKLRVYLSGWSQELEYRKIAERYCKDCVDLVNPMDITWTEVNRDIGQNCAAEFIVRRDKMQIDSCHILVAYIRVGPTWGTTMEMQYAYMKGIPVFMIDPTPGFSHWKDAWCRAHVAKVFSSIEECFDFIMNKNKKE